MASTYTNIGIEKQATGENANTWGTKTNTNFDIIDERISEIYEISSTSATQTIAAPTDATAGQNTRSATLKYTGAASADMVVTLPSDVKITYNVLNWGTGDTGVGTGYDITFKVGSGTNTAIVKNGKSGIIHSDGEHRVYLVSNSGSESFNTDVTIKTDDGALLKLQTSHDTIDTDDVLGAIQFNAPEEGDGADGDAQKRGAEIVAIAEAEFTDAVNKTTLQFKTGSNDHAETRMFLNSNGVLSIPADGSTTTNSIHLGAGADLKIYHDGSNSYVDDTGQGALILNGSTTHLYHGGSNKLQTTGDGIQLTGALGVNTAPDSTAGSIRATNDITAFYSDERLKDIHGSIENALDKVCQLDGFIYSPNDTAEGLGYDKSIKKAGISAQQCEKVLPEAVTEAPVSSYFKAVQYDQLIPLLINSIKELKEELDSHKQGCKCHGSTS